MHFSFCVEFCYICNEKCNAIPLNGNTGVGICHYVMAVSVLSVCCFAIDFRYIQRFNYRSQFTTINRRAPFIHIAQYGEDVIGRELDLD